MRSIDPDDTVAVEARGLRATAVALRRLDLSDDSKATRFALRRAVPIGVGFTAGAVVVFAAAVAVYVRGQGTQAAILGYAVLALFLYATLALYIADVRSGNVAAKRGMIVGAGSLAAWLGWGCAWTSGGFSASLFAVGAIGGAAAGILFGAILGVFLGWYKGAAWRRLARRWPKHDGAGGQGDGVRLDEL